MDRQPRSIEQLVEDQIRRWMASHTRQVGAAPPPVRHRVITVSREYGSQGERLARLVAERMGWTCWDQELLHEVSKSTLAPARLLETLDEHRRTSIEALAEVFKPASEPSDAQYLREVFRVVHTVAAQGKAVIVGRGSQFILGRGEALHVRVIAPFDFRVRGLVARRGWSEAEARQAVLAQDADRKAYLKASFGMDATDPHHYDLVVNAGSLPVEHLAELIELAWSTKFPQG